jgi:hypothetical protein
VGAERLDLVIKAVARHALSRSSPGGIAIDSAGEPLFGVALARSDR